MSAIAAGFDIGGTKCAVVLGELTEPQPVIIAKASFPTADPEATISRLLGELEAMLSERPGLVLRSAGISCGGPLNAQTGRILSPPNLAGWDDVPIVDVTRARLDVPVRLENDANACAVAEWKFGAARGARNAVFLTFGTGMGAGLIVEGRLVRGASGMAGEVGHIRLSEWGPVGYGKVGSFEGFCSGGGLAQLARLLVLERQQRGEAVQLAPTQEALRELSVARLAELAKAGDEVAIEAFRQCGEYLGRGLAVLVDLLNPELVVIGSVYLRCEEMLRQPMLAALRRESLAANFADCQVVPAGLGEAIGDYAALGVAALAIDEELPSGDALNSGTAVRAWRPRKARPGHMQEEAR